MLPDKYENATFRILAYLDYSKDGVCDKWFIGTISVEGKTELGLYHKYTDKKGDHTVIYCNVTAEQFYNLLGGAVSFSHEDAPSEKDIIKRCSELSDTAAGGRRINVIASKRSNSLRKGNWFLGTYDDGSGKTKYATYHTWLDENGVRRREKVYGVDPIRDFYERFNIPDNREHKDGIVRFPKKYK